MISVKKQGPYEVFSRGVEEPWAIWRDGRPYQEAWTWNEVDVILRDKRRHSASTHPAHATIAAPAAYRVAVLVPNPRRGEPGQETMLRQWLGNAGADALQTMRQAMATLRVAKRRGYTAWVVDAAGRHVPVKGAMRPYPGTYSE